MITITSGLLTAVIPEPLGFDIVSSRPQSSRQTLRGTMIHQFAAKSVTSSIPVVSCNINADQAAIIEAIDAAAGTCYVSDGKRLFLSTIDAKISSVAAPGKKKADIEFRVVREISWE